MSLLLEQSQTSSTVPVRGKPREAVATGLLIDAVFGTNAGVIFRSLRNDVFGVTTVPLSDPWTTAEKAVADEVRSLRDAICAAGISRQGLARLLGVDRRSLSGWASGEIRPARERVDALRVVARTVAEIDADRPGRVAEVMLTARGTTTLIDAVAAGRTSLDLWRSWLSRGAAAVTVTARPRAAEPIWTAAARAMAEGRLTAPTWERTVRPESTYEMNPHEEAAPFAEPDYESGRHSYR
jgi:DNA-binding transcriptional regulator YiaG